MSGGGGDPLADALIAARLCAIDPSLGGIVLRGGGELRNRVVAALKRAVRRVPVHIDDERLLGGLDLGATLAAGRPVTSRGLLAEAEGGVVLVPMAERMAEGTAARIAGAIDSGAGFVLVLLDDGGEDEAVPGALAERVGFWCDLTIPPRDGEGDREAVEGALHAPIVRGVPPPPPAEEAGGPPPRPGEDQLSAIAGLTLALGIDSARAPLFALKAARAAAVLAGRDAILDEDIALAARLVLGPRATRMPAPPDAQQEAPPPPEPEHQPEDQGETQSEPQPIDDMILEAALASLPPDLLAKLASGAQRRGATSRARGAGERRKSAVRGRPKGARAGIPRGGLRLALIDTLRAAAPWQKLRGGGEGRVRIRKDDLRVRRFETRAEALTIFAVDASGSSALARLAEAKGAVELLLAQAYVSRAHVALVAFRGSAAELLLPPTRSLARARRCLSDLPGGGGTPLAAGLNAARELAEVARSRGRTPYLVVLTDGRGNVALDGGTVRATAEADAETAARAIGLAGIASAFVDISPRPRPEGAKLAAAMRARYLPLPRADAHAMHAAVSAVAPK